MRQNKKRGFTIVELVIVIAVIAILAAVLIPTFANLIRKSKVSTDQQLIRNLNTALRVGEATDGKNKTMHDALEDAKEAGYDIAKINASATDNEILWDGENDVFVYYNSDNAEGNRIEYLPELNVGDKLTDTENTYKLWKIYGEEDEVPEGAAQNYSIYWNKSTTTVPTLTVGFDAGETIGISNVNYTNTSTGKTAVIRTNSFTTTLTINAESDTINHYGSIGEVDITAVAMHSYNECGSAAFVKVAAGRVVAKDGGNIAVAFTDATEISKVVITEENGTIKEGYATQTTVANDNSSNGGITLKTQTEKGESVSDEKSIEGIVTEAKNELLDEERKEVFNKYNYWTGFAADGFAGGQGTENSPYEIATAEQLAFLAESMNNAEYAKYQDKHYKLTADIDLSGRCWIPIVNSARNKDTGRYFKGTFNGDHKTIKGLNSIGLSMTLIKNMANGSTPLKGVEYVYGLFGCINGATIKNVNLENVDIQVGDGSKMDKDGEYYVGDAVGALVGFAIGEINITDCHTLSGLVQGYDGASGLIGKYHDDGDVRVAIGQAASEAEKWYITIQNCSNAATINAVRRAAGIVGNIRGAQATADHNTGICVLGCTNTGTITTKFIDDYDRSTEANYYAAAGIANVNMGWSAPTESDKDAYGKSNYDSSPSFSDCTNEGTVNGSENYNFKIAGGHG